MSDETHAPILAERDAAACIQAGGRAGQVRRVASARTLSSNCARQAVVLITDRNLLSRVLHHDIEYVAKEQPRRGLSFRLVRLLLRSLPRRLFRSRRGVRRRAESYAGIESIGVGMSKSAITKRSH